MDDALRAALRTRPDASALDGLARAGGLVPMRDHGMAKARAGLTSVEEVLRVVGG
jgi:general secretion pathway protein E